MPCFSALEVPYPDLYCFSLEPLLEGPQSKTECNVSVPIWPGRVLIAFYTLCKHIHLTIVNSKQW